jgi:hypothetical protein
MRYPGPLPIVCFACDWNLQHLEMKLRSDSSATIFRPNLDLLHHKEAGPGTINSLPDCNRIHMCLCMYIYTYINTYIYRNIFALHWNCESMTSCQETEKTVLHYIVYLILLKLLTIIRTVNITVYFLFKSSRLTQVSCKRHSRVTAKLFLCVTNQALLHTDVWRRQFTYRSTFSWPRH